MRLAGVFVLFSLLTTTAASAAYPKAEIQYANKTMKASFTAWAKKHLPGAKVGAVSCKLPSSGTVIRCTVHVSAPQNQENILFRVKGTLHDSGQLTWVSTSHSCTDSKTGKPFAC